MNTTRQFEVSVDWKFRPKFPNTYMYYSCIVSFCIHKETKINNLNKFSVKLLCWNYVLININLMILMDLFITQYNITSVQGMCIKKFPFSLFCPHTWTTRLRKCLYPFLILSPESISTWIIIEIELITFWMRVWTKGISKNWFCKHIMS